MKEVKVYEIDVKTINGVSILWYTTFMERPTKEDILEASLPYFSKTSINVLNETISWKKWKKGIEGMEKVEKKGRILIGPEEKDFLIYHLDEDYIVDNRK